MAVKNEMFKKLVEEIDRQLSAGEEKRIVDITKAKNVAEMLSELSMDSRESDSLVNQYIANIKNICEK